LYPKLAGLKTTLWSGLVVSLVFVITTFTQAFWQDRIPLIEQVIYGLFVIGLLFSAQFGRSRFTLLISLWFIYYLIESGQISGKLWLEHHQSWLFLSGTFCFALLTRIKDRGIVSIHGLTRLIAILACGLCAQLWLDTFDFILSYTKENKLYSSWFNYFVLDFPLYISAFYVFYKSLRTPTLLQASLLTSLIIWSMLNNQQLNIPSSIILTLLLLHYILVVVIDSYFLAYRDELTRLPSRRALNQYSLSLGGKYTVAMLDIDHFKKFNDNYGHDIGDQVLKLVAAKLAQVKAGGRVFRYGGEEFTAIFPRKDVDDTLSALEQLRQSVADYDIVIRHPLRTNKKARKGDKSTGFKTVNVTISIGVSARENKATVEQTIKQADLALYRAKKKGRNNVSC